MGGLIELASCLKLMTTLEGSSLIDRSVEANFDRYEDDLRAGSAILLTTTVLVWDRSTGDSCAVIDACRVAVKIREGCKFVVISVKVWSLVYSHCSCGDNQGRLSLETDKPAVDLLPG